MRGRTRPMLIAPGDPPAFPDPRGADDEGLLAIGGDLTPARLLAAYSRGIFPWFDEGLPPLWWCPNPRAIIECSELRVSRSMRRVMRHTGFELTCNAAFEAVMQGCAAERQGGTWILPEMVEAYVELHRLGHAISFEVWRSRELVGGLYGVQLGRLFAAESMFHRESNASKLALIASVKWLFAAGVTLFDVQFVTQHLASLGARSIPRTEYLERVEEATKVPLHLSREPAVVRKLWQ